MSLTHISLCLAAAAGANMGGTSGLQYEPPWQRQQQQQNQMRLQQLMQQNVSVVPTLLVR